jgi:DNA polymerase
VEPSKSARADNRVQDQIRDWLQYGADLGLGPYYRDRRSSYLPLSDASTALAAGDVMIQQEAHPAPAQHSAAIPTATGLENQYSMPDTKSVKSPAPAVLPIAPVESLFDSLQRIEGDTLPAIRDFIGDCTRCKLHKGRTKIVFGTGNPKAQLMFVGEGPGRDEDLSGEPFVGRAGKLLTDMIKAMGLQREDVYIANVVKCRPPENRLPERDEIETCSPFLMRQIDVIKPKVICTLGSCSAQTLLQTTQGISRFRGEWFDFRGAKLMPTYHPAYLLRNPAAKSDVWKDLQKVMAVLGLQPKKR